MATVEIDVEDYLDEVDDETLIEELRSRDIAIDGIMVLNRDYAERAYHELLGKRYGAALALLERALFPTDAQPSDVTKGSGSLALGETGQ